MEPNLYYSLTNVRGFTDLNGNSYKEYIILILGKFLDKEIKNKIKKTKIDKEALALIPFPYTHSMNS